MSIIYYILFIIFGIIIFILWNRINRFSIGGPNVRIYRNDGRNPRQYYLINVDDEIGGVSDDQMELWGGFLTDTQLASINTFLEDTRNEINPMNRGFLPEPLPNVPIEEPSSSEIFKAQLISIGLSEDDAENLRIQFINILSPGHIGLGSISLRGQLPSLPTDICAAIVNLSTLFNPQEFIDFLRDLLASENMRTNLLDVNNILNHYLLLLPFLTDYARINILNAYVALLKNNMEISRHPIPNNVNIRKFIWLFLRNLLPRNSNNKLNPFYAPGQIDQLYSDNNGPPLDPPGPEHRGGASGAPRGPDSQAGGGG